MSNFSEYTSSLLCENIIDESLSQRSHKRLSRYDVLAMAVHMNRTELVNSSDYRGSFEDVTRNMYAVVQTGLDI
ncbi:hypothetical protein H6768_04760 [Candidatus Peribacteria bacterium]|nr:hypothetical protein [Candidatus Peribacteria bacterium]